MKMLIVVPIQFIKCVLLLSKPKARHQKLLIHELVNYEFICEGIALLNDTQDMMEIRSNTVSTI